MFRTQDTRIHLVGIGEVFLSLGYKVSGCDPRETEITKHLQEITCGELLALLGTPAASAS
jgi:UDP-N-acetylmuramate-alanine ligase